LVTAAAKTSRSLSTKATDRRPTWELPGSSPISKPERSNFSALSGTASFFQAPAQALVANILSVTVVYCFAMISARATRARSRLAHLWLIVMVFSLMLYGLYT
jgi:hypothetical protein